MNNFLYKQFLVSIILFFIYINTNAQLTPYELNGKNYTATYEECISFYKELSKKYRSVSIETMGMTDAGEPLHVVVISSEEKNNFEYFHKNNKIILLINNGIHPGEPDGIDASMMLARDMAIKIENDSFPNNIAIAIIPVYNIGGCFLRSEFNRVDQNGPEAFGSRGNSQNLDLNRDFIKCDSKEARSFAEIFHLVQPDIFIDNHVSDGADYQHVMTLASTQHNKLGGVMGYYLNNIFEPALFNAMKKKNYPIVPYVNVWGKDAKDGWTQFFDSPRYSSGYAAMFNVFGFTIETHMLKPYEQRVDATYKLMETIIEYGANNANEIKSVRAKSLSNMLNQKIFPIAWNNDESKFTEAELQGYNYKNTISKVSGLPVKYYDRNEPYTTPIKFYNTFKPTIVIDAPEGYIIPQSCWKALELLQLNNVEMTRFDANETIEVEVYKITKYESSATPYEGHHANEQIEIERRNMSTSIRKGDFYISLHQNAKRFIIETLEPQASDSYFTWNFFDAFLIQKEGYSDYAYEEYAATYLNEHPEVRTLLTEHCKSDTTFAKSASAQLNFVYRHSPYVEPRHNVYPIYRVLTKPNSEGNIENQKRKNKIKNKEDE